MSEHPKADPDSPPQSVEIPPNSKVKISTQWPKKMRNAVMATGATGAGALLYIAVEATPAIVHWFESKAQPSSADVTELNKNVSDVGAMAAETNKVVGDLAQEVRAGFEQLRIIQTRNIERNNGQDKRLDTAEDEIRRLRDAHQPRSGYRQSSEGLDR